MYPCISARGRWGPSYVDRSTLLRLGRTADVAGAVPRGRFHELALDARPVDRHAHVLVPLGQVHRHGVASVRVLRLPVSGSIERKFESGIGLAQRPNSIN